MKKVLFMLVMLFAIIMKSFNANAAEEKNVAKRETVESFLKEYESYRQAQFYEGFVAETDQLVLSESVKQDSEKRANLISLYRKDIDISFVEVAVAFTVDSIDTTGDKTLADVKESTEIYYVCNGYTLQEYMSFITEHKMVLVGAKDKITLESDDFDESLVFGMKSHGYDERNEYQNDQANYQSSNQQTSINAISSYNPASGVAYANTWWNSYNTAQYYTASNDCANFVSQCLHYGGVPLDGTWSIGSSAWENVRSFDSYWSTSLNRFQLLSNGTNYSKCLAGNPIYRVRPSGSPTGHLTMCVGFNSSGTPIYNAHNPNVYHVAVSTSNLFSDSGYSVYTLEFAHQCTYSDAGSVAHKKTCSICGDYQYESHSWVTITLNNNVLARQCSKCGRITYANKGIEAE